MTWPALFFSGRAAAGGACRKFAHPRGNRIGRKRQQAVTVSCGAAHVRHTSGPARPAPQDRPAVSAFEDYAAWSAARAEEAGLAPIAELTAAAESSDEIYRCGRRGQRP